MCILESGHPLFIVLGMAELVLLALQQSLLCIVLCLQNKKHLSTRPCCSTLSFSQICLPKTVSTRMVFSVSSAVQKLPPPTVNKLPPPAVSKLPPPTLNKLPLPNCQIAQSPNRQIAQSPNRPNAQSHHRQTAKSSNRPMAQSPDRPMAKSPNRPIATKSPNRPIAHSPNRPIAQYSTKVGSRQSLCRRGPYRVRSESEPQNTSPSSEEQTHGWLISVELLWLF